MNGLSVSSPAATPSQRRVTGLPGNAQGGASRVLTGFMGGLTTFSTFSSEVVGLTGNGEYLWAAGAASAPVRLAVADRCGHCRRGSALVMKDCPFCHTQGAVLGNALA